VVVGAFADGKRKFSWGLRKTAQEQKKENDRSGTKTRRLKDGKKSSRRQKEHARKNIWWIDVIPRGRVPVSAL